MSSSVPGQRWRARRIWGATTSIVVMLMASLLAWSPAPASAATPPSSAARVDLRVLVIDDASPRVKGLEAQMTNEGIPFTAIDVTPAANHAPITAAQLSSGTHAFFQAVILPDATAPSLSAAELAALRAFEATFAVREVDAFVYPNAAVGSVAPAAGYDIAGATATVTAAGLANGFQYLNGPVVYGAGSYTYFATPLTATTDPAMPAGARFTPLVSAPIPGASPAADGSIIGVYAADGVERLVITSAFSSGLSQFQAFAPGIPTWATRGVHLGYNRNYFTMHVDDAFSSDNTWDAEHNCTPGEDCPLDPTTGASIYPELPVRMTPDDVTYAAQWSATNNYALTLAFNGFYADAATDTLTQALVAQKNGFRWLNHGLEHIYQGCVQDFTVVPWKCATDPTTGAVQYVSQTDIFNEIQKNITVGKSLGLPFDAAEYLSGEHSGLIQNPQQTIDNPNFVAAVAQSKLKVIGADASREPAQRTVGGALTIPRHPTAIYYNAGTVAQEIDEYNWLYNTVANGGSGYCEANPGTATCLTAPLDANGFTSYIVPTDAAFDLHFILANDPRPFYAHVSNLAEDRILYPLLNTILGRYRAAFSPNAPLVNLTETQAATVLQRQAVWSTSGLGATPQVAAYVQNGKVTITNSGTGPVPVTLPEGSTVTGTTLEPYAGERSAWLPAKASTTVNLPAAPLTLTGS